MNSPRGKALVGSVSGLSRICPLICKGAYKNRNTVKAGGQNAIAWHRNRFGPPLNQSSLLLDNNPENINMIEIFRGGNDLRTMP